MSDEVNRMMPLCEVAVILGIHINTLKRWIYSGKVKAVKIGRAWKVSEEEVDKIRKEGIEL